ncbi:MAG: S8 family serine peptidase [Flavobacteriaceae bacterium]|nr:S8 family serine peptidase [Flavobacteriaceae bacterium]
MEANSENQIQEDVLEIHSFIPPRKLTEEEQKKIKQILDSHPRDRDYISYKEHTKILAPDKDKIDELLAYAKSQNWKIDIDKRSRQATIKIHSKDVLDSDDTNPSHLESLRFVNKQGDLILNYPIPEEVDALDSPTQKTGFVKQNQESRGGKRARIPLQSEEHGYSVLEIAQAYNFPDGDGEGQTIGIIELGGQYIESDLEAYFAKYDIKQPKIQVVGAPSTKSNNDNVEVTADIQVAGILAPKAKFVIYYGNSILDAMKTALNDWRNKPDIISISWAGSEFGYSELELNELNTVFYEASIRGITVVAASGDYGAYNNKQFANVSVPTNFPYVLGCGGTQLNLVNDLIASEVVWNESQPGVQIGTGGGFSQKVTEPEYQQTATLKYINQHPEFAPYHKAGGRSVPDVAANAADTTGYTIFFHGQWTKVGGTSLATPLWAALVARLNQNLGYRLGFFNPLLYKLMNKTAFHQIVEGNNNLYVGAPSWNPCTGLGSPNGKALLEAIQELS